MELNWTEPALADLDEIYYFIAADSPEDASAFLLRLIDAVTPLETQPRSGRTVPEADDPAIREIVFQDYRILYWIAASNRVDILAVIHAAREMARLAPSMLTKRMAGAWPDFPDPEELRDTDADDAGREDL